MTNRKVFDIEELTKVFRIVDGKLERLDRRGNPSNPTWKVVENNANQGRGYCQVLFNGRKYRYHVILWVLHNNENIPEGFEIDHINGDRIDNRIENLRLVSKRENCQNMQCHRDGKLVGVSYCKRKNKYRTQLTIDNKLVHIGYYQTDKEASKAYKIACKYVEKYIDNESFREMLRSKLYA